MEGGNFLSFGLELGFGVTLPQANMASQKGPFKRAVILQGPFEVSMSAQVST